MTKDQTTFRLGMIVPSSNVTMEKEIPALLQQQAKRSDHQFSFHSSRISLKQVTPEALKRMNQDAGHAVDQLCDAQVDAILYACLVAVMYSGKACVEATHQELSTRALINNADPKVITSAGALLTSLKALKAKNVSMITPYKKELTERVADTLREDGFTIVQTHSREVTDNAKVGTLDPSQLLTIASQMDLSGTDVLVLSACVQMPSLSVIDRAEQKFGLPVISAATASAFALLTSLQIKPEITNAGSLLHQINKLQIA
jgi:maleate isomerase